MIGPPWRDTESLPSVNRFLRDTADSFENGQNVIVLLPPPIWPTDVCDWLHTELDRRDISVDRLDVSSWERVPATPQALVNRAINAAVGKERPLAELFREPGFPNIFLLTGIAAHPPANRSAWLRLIAAWADESRRIPGRCSPCVFYLLEKAAMLPKLPKADIRLALRYWWGFPSSLELRTHCRNLEGEDTVLAAWRESLVAGVAPGDASLAAHLWTVCPKSISELRAGLLEFASRHAIAVAGEQPGDWSMERVFACMRTADRPNDAQHGRWAIGGIIGSPEYGAEQHPCQIAASPDQRRLEHLLWRGQQQLLLPLVDRVRIAGCHHVTEKLGVHWLRRYITEDTADTDRLRLEESPLAADFGHLCSELSNLQDGRRGSEWVDQGRGSPVAMFRQVRAVRNQLAHYRPLDFPTFDAFWRAVHA